MKLWCRKEFIRRAIDWKLEKEAVLSAEVQILETLLRTSREELAEVRNLSGRELMARFGWEPGNQDNPSADWQRETEEIWMKGEHNLKSKGAAA